ncbi:hypothetical protein [Extibacter sp. GGCC_0201]|uniref:hypothetical protein n=1 Tax=Extibacter sp. GGCC_0201 TaxID=2731209 RepID=UPI001AA10A63|nr:hypothetical protein [Extibacter sp. GGCC_0201]MBO1721537.1 hypothetical protein [Extibacter sp. GGCC_0201]
MVVVVIAPALVVKGKLADFVVAVTVKVEDVCLVVAGKLLEGFSLAGRVRRAFFAVPAVQLGFLIFLQLVGVVVSGEAFRGLIAGDFAAIARDRPILSKVAFLFPVYYGIACGILGVRLFKVLSLDIKVNALLLALLPDISEELREGYVAPLDFNVIIRHGVGLLKDYV